MKEKKKRNSHVGQRLESPRRGLQMTAWRARLALRPGQCLSRDVKFGLSMGEGGLKVAVRVLRRRMRGGYKSGRWKVERYVLFGEELNHRGSVTVMSDERRTEFINRGQKDRVENASQSDQEAVEIEHHDRSGRRCG